VISCEPGTEKERKAWVLNADQKKRKKWDKEEKRHTRKLYRRWMFQIMTESVI
jgi:hypothetical protein